MPRHDAGRDHYLMEHMREQSLNRIKSLLLAVCLIGCSAFAQERQQYIAAMRKAGFADLAIEYIKREQASGKIADSEKADLDYEIGATLLAEADSKADLALRDQRLSEGRLALADFAKKWTNHPKRPDALAQVALANLQQGRLRVLQAQLPGNASQTNQLAEQARTFLKQAVTDYQSAETQLDLAYKKMPAFIPEEETEQRAEKAGCLIN